MDEQEHSATSVVETTPLLSNNNESSHDQDVENRAGSPNVEEVDPRSDIQSRTPRSIVVMTALIPPLAVFEVASYITGILLGGTIPWRASWDVQPMIAFTVLASIAAIINLVLIRQRGVPLAFPINFVLDASVGLGLFAHAAPGLDDLFTGYTDPFDMLLVLTFVFGMIISLLLFVVFIVRCVTCMREQRRQSTWTIPTGQVTFEFSIKYFRQDNSGSQSTTT